MPSLDELFASLSADADLVPPPELAVVEVAGRRRRLRQIATAGLAALALVVAAGTVVGIGQLRRSSLPTPEPAEPAPVQFHALREVGTGLAYGDPAPARAPVVSTTIADGFGYAVWSLAGGDTFVGAVDERTGRARWAPHRVAGPAQGNGLVVAGGVLAVVVGTSAPYAVIAVDPETGTELWHGSLDFEHTEVLRFPSVLVTVDRSSSVITGVDWRTGRTVWTVTYPPAYGIEYARGVATPADVAAARPEFSDPRLVVVGTDQGLRVYDAKTGRVTFSRSAPPGEPAFGYNGQLYTITEGQGSTPRKVYATDPFGDGAPRVIYTLTLPSAPRQVPMSPCGALICVLDGSGITAVGSPKLVAVDPATGATPWWIAGLPDLRELTPLGTRVLGTGDGAVGLYGPLTSQTLTIPDRSTNVLPIDAGSVLTLVAAQYQPGLATTEPRDTYVNGLAVAAGAANTLGTVRIVPDACTVDSDALFCPTDTGLRVWRFAGE